MAMNKNPVLKSVWMSQKWKFVALIHLFFVGFESILIKFWHISHFARWEDLFDPSFEQQTMICPSSLWQVQLDLNFWKLFNPDLIHKGAINAEHCQMHLSKPNLFTRFLNCNWTEMQTEDVNRPSSFLQFLFLPSIVPSFCPFFCHRLKASLTCMRLTEILPFRLPEKTFIQLSIARANFPHKSVRHS